MPSVFYLALLLFSAAPPFVRPEQKPAQQAKTEQIDGYTEWRQNDLLIVDG
jgi:hypothetical protein